MGGKAGRELKGGGAKVEMRPQRQDEPGHLQLDGPGEKDKYTLQKANGKEYAKNF